jgi:ribonuclease Z
MNLEAFILGSGGMMPLPGRFLTSVLLRREGELFLFDCGEATQISLKRLNLKWKKISRIFISHVHADHITGLPGILMLSSQVDRDEPLYIYGPARLKEYIEFHKKYMYLNYEIIVEEIKPGMIIYENDEYHIETFALRHTVPCLAYSLVEKSRPGIFFPGRAQELGVKPGPLYARLQAGETITLDDGTTVCPSQVMGEARSGRKFCFITDTEYFPEIASFAANSDLLICESMFRKGMEDTGKEKKHLSSVQAAAIASEAGNVKKLGLIHFSPRYMKSEIEEMASEAKTVFTDTFLTRDRMHIPIPFVD